MTELAELRRAVAEHERDRPVEHEPQPPGDAGHHREVIRAPGEPRREAAEAQPENRRDRLVAPEIDEHAERPVAEAPQLAVTERRGDVVGDEPSLAKSVLRGRWRGGASPLRRVGYRRAVADCPYVVEAGDAQLRVDLDPAAAVERQPELADDARRLHAGRPA